MPKKQKVKRKSKKGEVVKAKPERSLQEARERMAKLQQVIQQRTQATKQNTKFAVGAGGQLFPVGLSFEELDISDRDKVVQNLMKNTLQAKLQLWMVNLRMNIKEGFLARSTDVKDEMRRVGSCITVGNGPSLYDFKHIPQIKQAIAEEKFTGTLIVSDSALIPCLKYGLVPDYVCSTDGDPTRIHQFYNHQLVKSLCEGKTKAVLMNVVSPNVFKKVEESNLDILTFGGLYDDPQEIDSLSRGVHFLSMNSMLHIGANVGAFCWNWGLFLGCRPLGMVGMDYGYRIDTRLEQTAYWSHLMWALRGNVTEAKKRFRIAENPHWKRKFLIDGLWEGYRDIFLRFSRMAKERGAMTYNCTGNGSLYDEEKGSIVQTDLETFINEHGIWTPEGE